MNERNFPHPIQSEKCVRSRFEVIEVFSVQIYIYFLLSKERQNRRRDILELCSSDEGSRHLLATHTHRSHVLVRSIPGSYKQFG